MLMTSNIKAIVFDFGGVLLDWNPRNLYRRYFPDNLEAMEQFLVEVDFMEWNAVQDRGRSFKEGISLLSDQYPQHSQLIHAFKENWEDTIAGEIPGSVEILKRLKRRGFLLYGLSNWSAETFPLIRIKYRFFDLFDDMIVSGVVGLIKPDPAIFTLLLERIRLPAHECLFIDDSKDNITVAGKAGLITILFRSPALLDVELAHLGAL
jgi:2-haloacid dehalogenase